MKIIVPLNCSSVKELKECLLKLDARVDIAEIWLDQIYQEFLANPHLAIEAKQLLKQISFQHGIEFLAVCKKTAENGKFPGTPQERTQILQQFLRLGGDFIDLDITQNPVEVIGHLPSQKLWLSFHDYEKADIEIIQAHLETMQIFEPAVYKFAVTPQNEMELDEFLAFAASMEVPAIFTTMGEFGALGRTKLPHVTWGAFYALDEANKTASGQPTLDSLSA